MDGQWTRVPGDRGETDLAEEEGTVLPQLGVEAAAKKMMEESLKQRIEQIG